MQHAGLHDRERPDSPIASGKPLRPSQTRMCVDAALPDLAEDLIQYFAPSPPSPTHIPRIVPLTLDA